MASLQESFCVMDFPSHMLQRAMSSNERATRLAQFQEGGLKVKSVCSGIDAPGEALRLLNIAQNQAAVLLGHSDSGDAKSWVAFSSWCDIGQLQTQFLSARAECFAEGCRPCLFRALEEHVPDEIRHELEMHVQLPLGTAQEQKSAFLFYKELGEKLRAKGHAAFPRDATAPCLTHLKRCPVRQSRVMPSGTAGVDPTLMTAGGLPCIAYSRVGLLRKGSDPTELAFQVWVSERKQWASDGSEDMFLFENVQTFPLEKIQQPLQDTHIIIPLSFTPKDSLPALCVRF